MDGAGHSLTLGLTDLRGPPRSMMSRDTLATSAGGWELETARWVVDRARHELAMLRDTNADRPSLDAAERRYRKAVQLVQRIRDTLTRGSA